MTPEAITAMLVMVGNRHGLSDTALARTRWTRTRIAQIARVNGW